MIKRNRKIKEGSNKTRPCVTLTLNGLKKKGGFRYNRRNRPMPRLLLHDYREVATTAAVITRTMARSHAPVIPAMLSEVTLACGCRYIHFRLLFQGQQHLRRRCTWPSQGAARSSESHRSPQAFFSRSFPRKRDMFLLFFFFFCAQHGTVKGAYSEIIGR